MSEKGTRLDVFLTGEGLSGTRELAKKLILSGAVTVNGKAVIKPSYSVSKTDDVEIAENELVKYVSRGALKLEAALKAFSVNPSGLVAADFGASTGGFTDLLLQNGAVKVYAIENGANQLHPKLIHDERVVSIENTNARYIQEGFIPRVDLVVMDVSFISQTKLYEAVTHVLKPGGCFISLIKPQFEAGKEYLNKRGVIKDERVFKTVVENIEKTAETYHLKKIGIIDSPILGGDGNKEFLACFKYYVKE